MSEAQIQLDRREALALSVGAVALSAGIGAAPALARTPGAPFAGRDQPFDHGWRFRRGTADGQEHPDFDDSGWRHVTLPHDWSIEDVPGGVAPAQLGPFDKTSKGDTATGYTLGGEGWYRKAFRLDGIAADARAELLFDGIYLESDVWLNGQHLAANVNGYRPFAVDLTPALRRGGDNVLAVRVRNLGQNSRWYSGSGLTRQVRLDVLPAGARLVRWGVGASTRSVDSAGATIAVSTRIEALGAGETGLELVTRLRDAAGKVVAEVRSPAAAELQQTLKLGAPHLWSPANPYLYALETELARGSEIVDRTVQPFGVRVVTMDPARGLMINGERVVLRGGCIHHDNGLLGACAYPEADERRIRLLQARGYNAIRSSHNIPSRSLREACDRLGMLLIAEAFDVWHSPKLPQDFSTHFADHWHEVVETMVLSARNSPSVIMWSIGNEIPFRATDEGVRWQWELANAVRRLDPTRPVTEALNGVLGAPMVAGDGTARPGFAGKTDSASTLFLDVPGYNYRLDDIEAEHAGHPERVVYASETFPHDVYDYWALANRAPYFLGEFVWTAIDYLGEAGVGATAQIKANMPHYFARWPWVVAWCGDIDLIGQQKAPSLARDVVWGVSPLEMVVQRPPREGLHEFVAAWGWPDETQSWNWAGSEGKPLAVRVYSSAERVELYLGGAKVGEKMLSPPDKMKAEFMVPFAPGTLEARAYRGGRMIGKRQLVTTGAPARLRLRPEPGAAPNALRYVQIEVLDAAGRVVPDAERAITLTLDGPGELIGFGSANPFASGSYQSRTATSFRGRALAIVRPGGQVGTVRIAAHSDGLTASAATIRVGV